MLKRVSIYLNMILLLLLIIQKVDARTFRFEMSDTENFSSPVFNFFSETMTVIPEKMKNAIGKTIYLSFENIDSKFKSSLPYQCPQNLTRASDDFEGAGLSYLKRSKALGSLDTIVLDESILNYLEKADISYPCGHGSVHRLAKALVIRELAYLFDQVNLKEGIEKDYISYCQMQNTIDHSNHHSFHRSCSDYLHSKRSVSESPYFLNLSGRNLKGLEVPGYHTNFNDSRSLNPHEFISAEDAFAHQMEFYLLDENYPCRRPSMTLYFDNIFGHQKFRHKKCSLNTVVHTSFDPLNAARGLRPVDLNPKNVYQIHYLFAGKGPQMMSKWGHTLIRVVMCPPNQAHGEHCLTDTTDDVVISFLALAGLSINNIDGLSGKYKSYLFMEDVTKIVKEYGQREFRDTVSLPIAMDAAQMERFIYHALEVYWSYEGRYFFLTNNCASEAMKLFRAAFWNHFEMQTYSSVSPLHVYRDLNRYGKFVPEKRLIDDKIITQNKDRAVALTYFFPGYSENLEMAFKVLVDDLSSFSQYQDFGDYARSTTAKERYQSYIDEALFSSDLTRRERITRVAAVQMIEDHIAHVRQLELAQELKKDLYTSKGRLKNQSHPFIKKLLNMQNSSDQTSPISLASKGYGIPLNTDIKALPKNVQESISIRPEEIIEFGMCYYKDLVIEMRDGEINKKWAAHQTGKLQSRPFVVDKKEEIFQCR